MIMRMWHRLRGQTRVRLGLAAAFTVLAGVLVLFTWPERLASDERLARQFFEESRSHEGIVAISVTERGQNEEGCWTRFAITYRTRAGDSATDQAVVVQPHAGSSYCILKPAATE